MSKPVTLTPEEILALHEIMNQHTISAARATAEADGYTEAAAAVRDFAGATAGTVADVGRGLGRFIITLARGKQAQKPRLTAEQVALLQKAGLA
jgi:hypothetical protein